MTTYKEDVAFVEAVMDTSLLQRAIEWIRDHLSPDEVFGEGDLTEWARANCTPADVFDDAALRQWAEDEGYVEGKN